MPAVVLLSMSPARVQLLVPNARELEATREEIADPHALHISTRVNGQVLQDSNTSNLIFRIPELVEFITASITLEPGDIIATGTPVGVGCFRKPPIFLQPGDMVEIEIEGLGKLQNRVESLTAR